MKISFCVAASLSVFLATSHVYAQQIDFTRIDVAQATDPKTWEVWGLTEESWRQYEGYMRGEGKYHYQHLDPVFVLGMIAETEQERDKFAQQYVQQEFQRTTRLIDFDTRYREQFNSMFGPLVPHDPYKMEQLKGISGYSGKVATGGDTSASHAAISSSTNVKHSFVPLEYGDRITMFVSPQCETCGSRFASLRTRHADKSGVSIDLFFVGEGVTDNVIRQWAVENDINPDEVSSQKITLNHDDRYANYGSPGVPAAFHVRQSSIIGKL